MSKSAGPRAKFNKVGLAFLHVPVVGFAAHRDVPVR